MNDRQQRLLVVDDDKSMVKVVRSDLEQAGYEVFAAHDGETSLHLLRREKPDLLVLDLMLPDRDGWEIAMYSVMNPPITADVGSAISIQG